MNGETFTIQQTQRITQRGAKSPFAIRYRIGESTGPTIKKDSAVKLIPELGAVLIGSFERTDGLRAEWWKLGKPLTVEGIRCRLYAEVWATRAGEKVRLLEMWYAALVPRGSASLADYALEIMEADRRRTLDTADFRPILSMRGDAPRDHRVNQREVMSRLLADSYRRLSSAIKAGKGREEARRAFIADSRALFGRAPDVEDMRELMQDPAFNAMLDAPRLAPRKSLAQALALASGWLRNELHTLTNRDLNAAMNRTCGTHFKAGYWPRLAHRIGLQTSRLPGRPESANSLPPNR